MSSGEGSGRPSRRHAHICRLCDAMFGCKAELLEHEQEDHSTSKTVKRKTSRVSGAEVQNSVNVRLSSDEDSTVKKQLATGKKFGSSVVGEIAVDHEEVCDENLSRSPLKRFREDNANQSVVEKTVQKGSISDNSKQKLLTTRGKASEVQSDTVEIGSRGLKVSRLVAVRETDHKVLDKSDSAISTSHTSSDVMSLLGLKRNSNIVENCGASEDGNAACRNLSSDARQGKSEPGLQKESKLHHQISAKKCSDATLSRTEQVSLPNTAGLIAQLATERNTIIVGSVVPVTKDAEPNVAIETVQASDMYIDTADYGNEVTVIETPSSKQAKRKAQTSPKSPICMLPPTKPPTKTATGGNSKRMVTLTVTPSTPRMVSVLLCNRDEKCGSSDAAISQDVNSSTLGNNNEESETSASDSARNKSEASLATGSDAQQQQQQTLKIASKAKVAPPASKSGVPVPSIPTMVAVLPVDSSKKTSGTALPKPASSMTIAMKPINVGSQNKVAMSTSVQIGSANTAISSHAVAAKGVKITPETHVLVQGSFGDTDGEAADRHEEEDDEEEEEDEDDDDESECEPMSDSAFLKDLQSTLINAVSDTCSKLKANGLGTDSTADENAAVVNVKCVCQLCGATVGDDEEMQNHLLADHVCKHCGKEFYEAASLHRHVRNIHENARPHKCPVCAKGFAFMSTLSAHLPTHVDQERQFACTLCDRTFKHQASLRKHTKEEHLSGPKPLQCSHCPKSFVFKCALDCHMRKHSGLRPFTCASCGAAFKHLGNLQKHVKVLHPPPCTICGDETKKCEHVQAVRAAQKAKYGCAECSRSYETAAALTVHLRTHTGEKPEICHICNRSFQHRSNLQKHLLKHAGKKPHACTVCPRAFYARHNLIAHMRKHSGDSPHECKTCGKRFCTKNSLQVHMNLHANFRPFACDVCGRQFSQLGNLQKHMSVHTGERPHVCPQCKRSFTDVSALKRHQAAIHERDARYVCEVCDKRFLHLSSVRSHRLLHTGVKPHKCETCGKAFTHKSGWIRHVRLHERPTRLMSNIVGVDKEVILKPGEYIVYLTE